MMSRPERLMTGDDSLKEETLPRHWWLPPSESPAWEYQIHLLGASAGFGSGGHEGGKNHTVARAANLKSTQIISSRVPVVRRGQWTEWDTSSLLMSELDKGCLLHAETHGRRIRPMRAPAIDGSQLSPVECTVLQR